MATVTTAARTPQKTSIIRPIASQAPQPQPSCQPYIIVGTSASQRPLAVVWLRRGKRPSIRPVWPYPTGRYCREEDGVVAPG